MITPIDWEAKAAEAGFESPKAYVQDAIIKSGGTFEAAAYRLGVSEQSLRKLRKKLKLKGFAAKDWIAWRHGFADMDRLIWYKHSQGMSGPEIQRLIGNALGLETIYATIKRGKGRRP